MSRYLAYHALAATIVKQHDGKELGYCIDKLREACIRIIDKDPNFDWHKNTGESIGQTLERLYQHRVLTMCYNCNDCRTYIAVADDTFLKTLPKEVQEELEAWLV